MFTSVIVLGSILPEGTFYQNLLSTIIIADVFDLALRVSVEQLLATEYLFSSQFLSG